MTRGDEFRAMIKQMERTLTAETDQRKQRPGLSWIEAERHAMHSAVNAERAARSLAPLDLAAVERVENMACGHSDYAHKFALYCAELALGVAEPQP